MNNISFRNDILPLKNVLFRLALRITLNREDAEDVVQDTLVKVWNKRDDWHEIDSIEAFCMTVCRNLSLDKVKKASRSTGSLEQTGTEAADRTGADPYDRIVQRGPVRHGETSHECPSRKTTHLHAVARL